LARAGLKGADPDQILAARAKTLIKREKPVVEPGSEEHLPSRRTFLLRFSDATGPEAGIYRGRVEHISTGKTARFTSMSEITEFAAKIMINE
jgi:hypothetical protein